MAPVAMQAPPAWQVAAWPTPNYVNPSDIRGKGNVILNITCFTILIVMLTIRIFTRLRLRRVFGADDSFILVAAIPTTAFFILSVLADTKLLWTRHVYDIPPSSITTGLKMVLATEICFALASAFTKLSMLTLVRRMLVNGSAFWMRITNCAILIVTIQSIVFCLTVMFQCRPPQDYWKITEEPQSNCINQGYSLLCAGLINTFTDFVAVILPIRTVWKLQLKTRDTIIVLGLFGCGFIAGIAGIIRTYYTYEVLMTWDTTWASYPVWITAAIELYVGIICASIPATKPFFSAYLPVVFGSLATNQVSEQNTSPYHNTHRTTNLHNSASSRPQYAFPASYFPSSPRVDEDEQEMLDLEKPNSNTRSSSSRRIMSVSTVTTGVDSHETFGEFGEFGIDGQLKVRDMDHLSSIYVTQTVEQATSVRSSV